MAEKDVPAGIAPELVRLSTFSTFPLSCPMSSISLVRDGFSYTGDQDVVTCYDCGFTYSGWQKGDNPLEIHRQMSPSCPFILANPPVEKEKTTCCCCSNAHKPPQELPKQQPPPKNQEPPKQQQPKKQDPIAIAEKLGVIFERPKYPEYSILSTRLSSFDGWLGCILPRDLALAGFLYAGYGDCARCFFCGVGLLNWDPDDDLELVCLNNTFIP